VLQDIGDDRVTRGWHSVVKMALFLEAVKRCPHHLLFYGGADHSYRLELCLCQISLYP
jgi:hypothetical protein